MSARVRAFIFFFVLIAVAVVIGAVTRTNHSYPKATYSEFVQQVQAGDVSKATIAVAETGANPVTYRLKSGKELQTIIPRDYKDALAAMQAKLVNVDIRDASSQRLRTIANASPFFFLLTAWAIMMIWMRRSPNWPRLFRG